MIRLAPRDEDSLVRILELCDRINSARQRYGDGLNSFLADEDYKDVVCMNLFQIGEVSHSLSDELKASMSEVPWREIYGLRNVIAHGYESLVEERIWNTVKKDIPQLSQTLDRILSELGEI